jgi:hypothetical protein
MKMEISHSGGLPKVAWVQETPETGATKGGQTDKYVIIGFVAIGAVVGLFKGDFAFIFMLIGAGAGLILSIIGLAMHHKEHGQAADYYDPILTKQYCEAALVSRGGKLMFTWSLKGRKMQDSFELPYAEVSELVVGGFNEWFGGMKGGKRYHESRVIVMPLRDGRVFRLANHAGAQADVTRLHAMLTMHFIEPRDERLRALNSAARQAMGSSESGVPERL